MDIWARYIGSSGQPGPDYWNFFAERVADLTIIPNDATVLDIGTCDGNVLFKAMKKIGGEGYGIGIDIDYRDFRTGVTEATQRGWKKKVAFVQMDANILGFIPETFHSVLANFVGWDHCFDFDRMEFIGPDQRTPEIMRVLRPGGQVGICSWIKQCDIDWIAEAFKKYLPEYEGKGGKSISSYGKENPEGYKVILQNNGFTNIHTHVETTSFVSPDAETWWQQMKLAAREYFKRISNPTKLELFKEQVFADLYQFQCPEGIRFSKTVFYAYGTKPA
jgi:ubiquinone/menaquinone biosynthesis C-methylase UbiE